MLVYDTEIKKQKIRLKSQCSGEVNRLNNEIRKKIKELLSNKNQNLKKEDSTNQGNTKNSK